MPDQESGKTEERTFGIGAVAKLTGLTDHTIRVWERRYQAVVASRAANGRRVYRSADIEKLQILKLLTDNGLSIGKIAGESLEALTARIDDMRKLAAPAEPSADVSVAILGELLPTLLRTDSSPDMPLRLLASGGQEAQLLADLAGRAPEVLVVELPVLAPDTEKSLDRLRRATSSGSVVCVYGFARSQDAERLRAAGIRLLRAPVTVEEAVGSITRAAQTKGRAATMSLVAPAKSAGSEALVAEGHIEPRLFSPQQLSVLANQSSAIDCECPQHLADLVGALSAFEVYSANCASASDADEILHRYLHRTTAQARALIEKALERVAREEGLL